MKKFNSRIRGWMSVVAVSAALLLTACNKSHNDDNINTPVAGLMAFNLSPDLAFGGFAISGNNLTPSPLAFNNYTGVYLGIYPGSRSLDAYNYNTGSTLASTNFNFEASKYYSAFLVGTDSSYRNVIVNDNFDSLQGDQSFVRYINAIPDPSSPVVTIAANGTNVVNDNAAFASVSQFVPIAPGSITISVNNGGTINTNRTITVEARKVYTILLAGKPGGSGDTAVQIKYITNGTVDASTGKAASASAKGVN